MGGGERVTRERVRPEVHQPRNRVRSSSSKRNTEGRKHVPVRMNRASGLKGQRDLHRHRMLQIRDKEPTIHFLCSCSQTAKFFRRKFENHAKWFCCIQDLAGHLLWPLSSEQPCPSPDSRGKQLSMCVHS